MAGSTKLNGTTLQQKLFSYAYFNNKGNGTKAAIEAGYSRRTAAEQASRLLSNVKVLKLLSALNEKIEEKALITKEQAIAEYSSLGLFDIRTIYDNNNALKPISEFSDEAARAVSSIETFEVFEGYGEDRKHIGNTIRIKLNSKIAALDSIRDTLGWKAVTKVASVTKDGEDISLQPAVIKVYQSGPPMKSSENEID